MANSLHLLSRKKKKSEENLPCQPVVHKAKPKGKRYFNKESYFYYNCDSMAGRGIGAILKLRFWIRVIEKMRDGSWCELSVWGSSSVQIFKGIQDIVFMQKKL